MLKNRKAGTQDDRKSLPVRLLLIWLALTLLAVAFIIIRRDRMNMAYQADRIIQRLDDYPQMLENYRKETDSLSAIWKEENERLLAQQAAFFYTWDTNHLEESERLAYAARLTGAAEARIIPATEENAFTEQALAADLNPAFTQLGDGRLMAVSLPQDENYNALLQGEYSFLLTCLEAGLPGHVAVLHEGNLHVYPEDETTAMTKDLISEWISSGLLDYDSLKEKAAAGADRNAVMTLRSPAGQGLPAGNFTLFCGAYADLDDFVINIIPTRELREMGTKRTVSLCVLTVAIFFLLAVCLWRTRLYLPDLPLKLGRRMAVRRSKILQVLAGFILVLCIVVIQMLSAVNQSASSAVSSAAFLQHIMNQEAARAEIIASSHDEIARKRANSAAAFLSDDPYKAEMDTLRSLDMILGGAGMRICAVDGTIMASDELYQAGTEMKSLQESETEFFRVPLRDENGRTKAFLDYAIDKENLRHLLEEARLKELLSDLHMLDTLHVLAVSKEERNTITAASRQSWVGDSIAEHGLAENLIYDGYEGLITLEGENLYARVFAAEDSLIVVGSEPVSPGVFLESIALLTIGLLLFLAVIARVVIHMAIRFQESMEKAGYSLASMSTTPPLRLFCRGFMLCLFLLSASLFVFTRGNPTGLTYNIVRGVWVRGINIVTLTTCLMTISAIVAVYTVLGLILNRVSGYLTPKGRTLCQLIESASHYVGAIIMVLYSLSMMGVETGALVGGVGVTALVFTLGANSLIADVLAGLFIIFEGNIMVGDVIIIGEFRGTVTDITIRTTKLKASMTGDVKIINNSQLKDLVNQSQTHSNILIDLQVSHDVGVARAEELIMKCAREVAARHPEVIGEPIYLGPVSLPEWNAFVGIIAPFPVRVLFQCREDDRILLTFTLKNELTQLANVLLGDPE